MSSIWKIDDFRFIKNNELMKIVKPLAIKQLEKLGNPEFIFCCHFYPSVVIDLANIHCFYIYFPIFTRYFLKLKGCIVVEVHSPNIKNFEDLLKSFTIDEHQKFYIKNVSSFYYGHLTDDAKVYQFVSTFCTCLKAKKYIENSKGNRIFNIKSDKFNKDQIYIAYQKEGEYDYAEIIDIDVSEPKSLGEIQIIEEVPKHRFSIFNHSIFHSTKRNNKTYKRLT